MIVTPSIELFCNGTSYDLTARCLGASCTTNAEIGEFGRASATFDFNNNDGLLTPESGLPSSLSSVDWFASVIRLNAVTDFGVASVFHGIVNGFQLSDDGKNSFVTISAVDAFTLAGSTQTTIATGATIVAGNLNYWIESVYNGNSTYVSSVGMPKAGLASSTIDGTNVGVTLPGLGTQNYSATARAGDFINGSIMPSGPNFAWPTKIQYDTSISLIEYNYASAQLYPIRLSMPIKFIFNQYPYDFAFPIQQLQRGFNSDELLNNSTVTTLPTVTAGNPTYSTSVTDTASQTQYGPRTVSFTSLLPASVSGANGQETTPAGAKAVAERWANSYSSSEFVTSSLVVSKSAMITKGKTAPTYVALFRDLLDMETGLLQIVQIIYRPTGMASDVIDYGIIMGRTIEIRPDDIRVNVRLMSIDSAPLMLNSAFAELGQNGYDDNTINYDSSSTYVRGGLIGARLG